MSVTTADRNREAESDRQTVPKCGTERRREREVLGVGRGRGVGEGEEGAETEKSVKEGIQRRGQAGLQITMLDALP